MKHLIYILFFLPLALFGQRNYYISNAGDDDTGDGSISNPYATITKLNTLTLQPGDSVLFNRGDIFDDSWIKILQSGTENNHIVYSAYGTGNRPIIEGKREIPYWTVSGNWDDQGGNVWRLPFSLSTRSRLFFDGDEGERTFYYSVDADKIWGYDTENDFLYVYSIGNPATNFSSIKSQNHLNIFRSSPAGWAYDIHYITVSHLDIRGWLGLWLRGCSNWIIEYCDIGRDFPTIGIIINYSGAEGIITNDVIIRNCTLDTYYRYNTRWDGSTYVTQDGLSIRAGSVDIKIHDNYFRGWGHAAIAFSSTHASYPMEGVHIYNNYFTDLGATYGRAITSSIRYASACNPENPNKFYNNIIEDQCRMSQIASPYFEIYNNIWNRVFGTDNSVTGYAHALSIQGYSGTAYNMKVYNNVFANAQGVGLWIADTRSTDYPTTDLIVANNIFYNNRGYDYYFDQSGNYYAQIKIDPERYGKIRDSKFLNNLFYSSGSNTPITINTLQVNASTFNTMSGGTQNHTIADNIQYDPDFTDPAEGDFTIDDTSPAYGAGIVTLSENDHAGEPWKTPPSIGAYEWYAAGYIYVSNTGDDNTGSGTIGNPFQTIAKVNTLSLIAGDSVLFNRGDTFDDATLQITNSGSSGNPIVFGAYGMGDKPIITSFTELDDWTAEGDDIYSHELSSDYLYPDYPIIMVTVDDLPTWMGRWPKTGYRTINSTNGSTSITDNTLATDLANELGLSGSDLIGADIFVKRRAWNTTRAGITNYSSNTLTIVRQTATYSFRANYGYFVQNHIAFLSEHGEWYYDSTEEKLYIYLDSAPANYTIKAATRNNLILFNNSYLVIENLDLQGCNSHAIFRDISYPVVTNNVFRNLNIKHIGEHGVNIHVASTEVTNCIVSNTGRTAISIRGSSDNLITYNEVYNAGIIPGIHSSGIGIRLDGAGAMAQYNRIDGTGQMGMQLYGNGASMINNYIINAGLIVDDIGGIYLEDSGQNYTGREVSGNIILFTLGNYEGTPYSYSQAVGIYPDELTNDVTITGNIVAYSNGYGFLDHKSYDLEIDGNIFFDNGRRQAVFSAKTGGEIYDIIFTNNTLVGKDQAEALLRISSPDTDYAFFNTINYNYYLRTNNIDDIFQRSDPGVGEISYDLAGWRTYTGDEANSIGTLLTEQIYLLYNDTNSDKMYNLTEDMQEPDGTVHSGSVTLSPWTGIVLIGTGTVPPSTGEYVIRHDLGNGELIKDTDKIIKH